MQELLEVATKYATREEVVQANFSGKSKAASHLSVGDGGDDPTLAQHRRDRRARNRKRHGEEMVATAEHTARPQPRGGGGARPEHFEKGLEAPYLFHKGHLKHLLKDYATVRGYIRNTLGQ
jgi:hypothetical protein